MGKFLPLTRLLFRSDSQPAGAEDHKEEEEVEKEELENTGADGQFRGSLVATRSIDEYGRRTWAAWQRFNPATPTKRCVRCCAHKPQSHFSQRHLRKRANERLCRACGADLRARSAFLQTPGGRMSFQRSRRQLLQFDNLFMHFVSQGKHPE